MFAGSYKNIDSRVQLSRLGVLGSVVTFLMLSLMIQWPLLQEESQFSAFSQFMLWASPVLMSLALSAGLFALAKWRSKQVSYSFGVTYHWVLNSLLPIAALISLAEYFALEPFPTALVHVSGLLMALGLYGLLLLSRQSMLKHSRVMLFAVGFYALAAALQLVLFAI
jgi:hypothetical protein